MSKVAIWPYAPGLKNEIIEDAQLRNTALLFCNRSDFHHYELVQDLTRVYDESFENALQKLSNTNKKLHILCMNRAIMTKLAKFLDHKKIAYDMNTMHYPV